MDASDFQPPSKPAQRRRQRRRPGENRQRLLHAAIAEFAQHGYRGASTSDIALRAGVPQPHLYSSFPSKRVLFIACVSAVAQHLHARPAPDSSVDLAVPQGTAAAFYFQAVAATADPDIGPYARELVTTVREVLGDENAQMLVLRGAAEMMRAETDD